MWYDVVCMETCVILVSNTREEFEYHNPPIFMEIPKEYKIDMWLSMY